MRFTHIGFLIRAMSRRTLRNIPAYKIDLQTEDGKALAGDLTRRGHFFAHNSILYDLKQETRKRTHWMQKTGKDSRKPP